MPQHTAWDSSVTREDTWESYSPPSSCMLHHTAWAVLNSTCPLCPLEDATTHMSEALCLLVSAWHHSVPGLAANQWRDLPCVCVCTYVWGCVCGCGFVGVSLSVSVSSPFAWTLVLPSQSTVKPFRTCTRLIQAYKFLNNVVTSP